MNFEEVRQTILEIEKSKMPKFKKAKTLSESSHDTHAEDHALKTNL